MICISGLYLSYFLEIFGFAGSTESLITRGLNSLLMALSRVRYLLEAGQSKWCTERNSYGFSTLDLSFSGF